MSIFLTSKDIVLELCDKEELAEVFGDNIFFALPRCIEEWQDLDGDGKNDPILYVTMWVGRELVRSCYIDYRVNFNLIGEPVCQDSSDLIPYMDVLRECIATKSKNCPHWQGMFNYNWHAVNGVKYNNDAIYNRYIGNRPCIQFSFDFRVCREDCF